MAVIKPFVEAVTRRGWIEAVAKMDEKMILDGKRIYERLNELYPENIVEIVDDCLVGDDIVPEVDIGVDDLVVGDHAFASAVLAEIGLALFELLSIVYVFVAPE